ncbi:MAG: PAS domain S-box protein [Terracidiphilus sp.]
MGTIAGIIRGQITRQVATAIMVVLALLVRVTLEQQSITLPTFVTFYPVVFLAIVFGGIWSGILATALSALLADYFLLPPVGQFTIHSTSDIVAMAIFCISGVSVSVATELYRRSRERAADSAIEAAILSESRKVEEPGEQAEILHTERLRFLDVLETLRSAKSSKASPVSIPVSPDSSAAGGESRLPSLNQRQFRASLRRTVLVPFIAALILGGAALWAAYELNASMRWVDHTDQVIGQSRRLLRLLVDMETGERGFLITGNDVFLQPYQEASNAIDSEYQALQGLVADDPSQQSRLEKLHVSLNHWQSYAAQMIALRRGGGAYTDLRLNLAGKAEVDEIRDQIAEFQSVEEHLRDERNRKAHRDWRLVETICILLGLGIGSWLMVFTLRRMEMIADSFEKSGRALKESEQRWATTLASIGDAVMATDSQGRVTFLNPAAVTLTGWQSGEAQGQPVQDIFRIINEQTRGLAEDPVGRVLKDGRAVQLANHTALLRKDGLEIPIADSAAPILDGDGKIAGVVLVFHDVTERRQAENVLQATLQRFYLILSNLSSGVLLVTDEGRIEFANQAFCSLFGLKESPADLVAKFDSEKVIARIDTAYENPERAILRIQEILEDGQSTSGEEIPMRNGSTFLRDYVPLTVDGKPYGRMWVHTDITELKRGEEALRESRAKLAAALASMTDSVIITDAHGRFVEFNESFAAFYRFKSKAECAKSFDEFTSIFEVFLGDGKAAPREMYAIQRALRGEQATGVEYTLRRKDTGESWIGSLSFGPVRDVDGKITGSVITARDVTEAKRAEMRLRRFYETDLFAILYWKIDGGVLDANEKFLEMTGYSREDLRAGLLNWSKMTPPEYWPLDEDARRQIRENGVHLPYEKAFVRKDGALIWGLFSAAAYDDDRSQGVSFILDITERKLAEKALRESEQRERERAEELAALFESVPLPVFIARDPNCLHLTGNRLAEEILRIPSGNELSMSGPEDTRPRNFRTFKDGRELRLNELPAQRSAHGEHVRDFEFSLVFDNGEVRHTLGYGNPLLDSQGNPRGAVATMVDITERKRAEENLRKLNRTLKAMSNSNQTILHATDESTFLEEVCRIITNDCGHAMVWVGVAEHDERKTVRPVAYSGFEEGYLETLGVTWDESDRGCGPTGTAIRTGHPLMCRNTQTDPTFAPWRDDAIKRGYASSLAIPLKEQGKAWGAITIYSRETEAFSEGEIDLLTELAGDVEFGVETLRLRAAHARSEQALRESSELLGLFVEHAPAALAMFDEQMRYLHASRRWRADYSLGDRDLRGVSHYDVFPEVPEQWREAHRRGLAGEVLCGEADRFVRANGTEQWIRWEVRPWRDAERKVGGIVIFSEEITERKKATEALLRSEKETLQRQQLRALAERIRQAREEERKMVARELHDQIGQILTAIKFDMTWAMRHLPPSEDDVQKRLTGSIELINDGVKSVRKICSGLRPGILDDMGLAAAIEWQANEFSSRTGVPCQLTLPPVALVLDSDRATAIFRIFQESLTNVARHAEARSVKTSLQMENEDLVLVVADDGKGFRESEVGGSLGVLGMKERAAAWDGSVQVSSAPGKGTKVTVRMPIGVADAEREENEYSDSR